MALEIYNSQSKKKEVFEPIREGEVRMYVCGPTVYNFLHVGNFRGAVFFNLVRNWLEKKGYKVNYVYNYTDVEDRIIERAKKEGKSPSEVSERFIKEFETDYNALKLRPHTHNPKVTDFMKEIIKIIEDLIENKKAYVVEGDVYYSIESFPNYGKLSNKKLDELESGSRIEVDRRKKHPSDFALWKASKPEEPSWDSPWGPGRPGWHIECSAMSTALLGPSIDIHGGGMDLIFPHHENEVAQSEGATGKPFVKYWMHNNMINFGDQKMSKSLGNIVTGRDFMAKYHPEILKYLLISVHYRSTSDLSDDQVALCVAALARVYSALALSDKINKASLDLVPVPEQFQKLIDAADDGIEKALDDDFNSPEVMARLFEVIRAFNSFCRKPGPLKPEMKAVSEVFYHWLRSKGELLALFQEPAGAFLTFLDDMLLEQKNLNRAEIDRLVEERAQARISKDFEKSDQIRDRLTELGIALHDSKEGSTWEVAK